MASTASLKPPGRSFQTEDRTRIFNLALDQVWPEAPNGLIKALIAVYRSHHPEISLAPDALRLLEAMKGGTPGRDH